MDTVPSLRTGKVIQVTQLNIYSAKLLKTKVMKQLNEMKKFLSKGAKTENQNSVILELLINSVQQEKEERNRCLD